MLWFSLFSSTVQIFRPLRGVDLCRPVSDSAVCDFDVLELVRRQISRPKFGVNIPLVLLGDLSRLNPHTSFSTNRSRHTLYPLYIKDKSCSPLAEFSGTENSPL